MKLEVQFDTRDYEAALVTFIRERRMALPQALRSEGRQLALRLVKLTPPKTLSQGRKAVARDIERALRPLRPSDFTSVAIRRLIRKRDYAGLQAVFQRFPEKSGLRNVAVVEARLPEMHQQARVSRGRVLKFQRRVTPDAEAVRDYIKKVQPRVGRGRSGWAASLLALGGKTQSWVTRHAGTGEFEDRADLQGYLRMENKSEWASRGDDDRAVANAIRSRIFSLKEAVARAQAEALHKAGLQ